MRQVLLVHVSASCVVSLPRNEAGGGDGEEEGVAPQVLPLATSNQSSFVSGGMFQFSTRLCAASHSACTGEA